MIELPTNSLGTLSKFFTDHVDIILNYTVRRISEDYDQEKLDLFTFTNSEHVARLNQEDYTKILNWAMVWFVEEELFEDAAICRDLITKISVENVIRFES